MECITVEQQGHVLVIGLNRPLKYNAFTRQMFCELAEAYTRLENDPALRCGMLFAHGKNFTAGLELTDWADAFANGQLSAILGEEQIDPLALTPDKTLSKPMVFAIHGICYTLGIELMLAADIRIAATDTRFGQIEVKRGIYAVGGATVRFYQEMGWGNAMRWLLTGDDFDGTEAHRCGLVQQLCPADEVKEQGLAMAQNIASQAPLGVYASLQSARITRRQGEQAAVAQLMPDLQPIMTSNDAKEGIQSFIERRPADFTGT